MTPTLALLWFSTAFPSLLHAAACDVDNDGDVDRLDLGMIIGARDTRSAGAGDARDADVDGAITILDARACIRQCSLADCKVISPAPAAAVDDAGRQNTTSAGRTLDAVGDSGKTTSASARSSSAFRGRAVVGGNQWQVKRGDTLYSIGRAVFPRDSARQARFRQDVMTLNPSVFANGAHNMPVGAVLQLPDYAGSGSSGNTTDGPARSTRIAPQTVAPGPPPQPAEADPPVELSPRAPSAPAPASNAIARPGSERQIDDAPIAPGMESTVTARKAQANASISLGYSRGGDRLDDAGDGGELYAGSGAQMRLGFEHMLSHDSGYRLALGLQYDLARDGGDSATFRDAYLQLAYQRRSSALVYGIGVAVHTGATQKADLTREYQPAAGAVAYLENVGKGILSGWGFSYTVLEIEEQNVGESIDASRGELYYSWRF